MNPGGCESVGPNATLSFEFTRPVDPQTTQAAFSTEPPLPGRWQWPDPRHAVWSALTPLKPGDPFSARFTSSSGLAGDPAWLAVVRSPSVLFLSTGEAPELYRVEPGAPATPLQITRTQGKVVDFSAAPSGEQIVYAATNAQNGADLWLVRRDGSQPRLLVQCNADRCTTPAWSRDGLEIFFSRDRPGLNPGDPRDAARPWVYSFPSASAAALFNDPARTGYAPLPSPDGSRVAMWNQLAVGIDLVDRASGATFSVPSTGGDSGCWESDGRGLVYETLQLDGGVLRGRLLRVDARSRDITLIAGGALDFRGVAFRNPACNPIDGRLAATALPNINLPAGEIWILSPTGEKLTIVYTDLTRYSAFYRWSPDGQMLLFKTGELSAGAAGQIEVWNLNGAGDLKVVAQAATQPDWLP